MLAGIGSHTINPTNKMNTLKKIIITVCSFSYIVILEFSDSMLKILDWVITVSMVSERRCMRCNNTCENITMKRPICDECASEEEEDDGDSDSDRMPHRMLHQDRSVMYR